MPGIRIFMVFNSYGFSFLIVPWCRHIACRLGILRKCFVFLQYDIVCSAFDNAGGGHQCHPGFLMELCDAHCAAGAHGRLKFAQRYFKIVLKSSGVRHVGIDAFFEIHPVCTAHVVSLPVAGPVGTFAQYSLT